MVYQPKMPLIYIDRIEWIYVNYNQMTIKSYQVIIDYAGPNT